METLTTELAAERLLNERLENEKNSLERKAKELDSEVPLTLERLILLIYLLIVI